MTKQAGRRKQHELKAKAAICNCIHPGQPCPLPKKGQDALRHGVGTMQVTQVRNRYLRRQHVSPDNLDPDIKTLLTALGEDVS